MNNEQDLQTQVQMKAANKILHEYFRNNRYPKKVEKMKLALKAGVSLQFVINFFYNTRSKIKSMEKMRRGKEDVERQMHTQQTPDNTHDSKHGKNLIPNISGKNNNLYRALPQIKPAIIHFYDQTIVDDIQYTKILVQDNMNENQMNTVRDDE